MLSIDPLKILLVLVVALVLLGPDKIPAAAHKISSFLKDLQGFRNSVHSQIRDTLEGTPLDDLARHGDLIDRLRKLDTHTLLEYLSVTTPTDSVPGEGPEHDAEAERPVESAPADQAQFPTTGDGYPSRHAEIEPDAPESATR